MLRWLRFLINFAILNNKFIQDVLHVLMMLHVKIVILVIIIINI